jgi:hypothetical protein
LETSPVWFGQKLGRLLQLLEYLLSPTRHMVTFAPPALALGPPAPNLDPSTSQSNVTISRADAISAAGVSPAGSAAGSRSFEHAQAYRGPPPLTCAQLREALSEIDLEPKKAAELLDSHLPYVLHIVSPSFRPKVADETLNLRREAHTTRAVPNVGQAETAHASAISSHLRMRVNDAHNLLRDFLVSKMGQEGAVRALTLSDSLVTAAPLAQVESFWHTEIAQAYAILAKSVALSGESAPVAVRDELSAVLSAHVSDIEGIIVDRTCTILARHTSATVPSARARTFDDGSCVLQVLFALATSGLLRCSSFISVLKCLMDAASAAAARNNYATHRHVGNSSHRALLDDSFSVLCLSASIVSVIGKPYSQRDAAEEGNASATGRLPLDHEKIAAVDSALAKVPDAQLAEVALLSYLWGSYAASRKALGDTAFAGINPTPHVQYAARFCVTRVIRDLFMDPKIEDHDKSLETSLRFVFWEGMSHHFLGFPPSQIPRPSDEVLDDLGCAITLLDHCSSEVACAAAVKVWLAEYSNQERWVGGNALLRLASVLFPLHFEPYLLLLTALCTDADAAMEVVTTLDQRLCTCTESPRSYYDSLERLNDQETDDLQNSITQDASERLARFVSMAAMVSLGPGDSSPFLVRPKSSLASYSGILRKERDLGVMSGDGAVVIWGREWNGWEAVANSLKALHTELCHPNFEDEQEGSSQVTACAIASLSLVEQICHLGSKETRQYVCERAISVDLVASIFNAACLLRRSSSASSASLTRSSRATIMAAAGSCLFAMSLKSRDQSRVVMDLIFSDGEHSSAMQSCISAVGFSSLPALSAMAMIARTTLLEESESFRFSLARDIPTNALMDTVNENPNSNAVRVCEFNTAVGLPLWFSLHQNGYPSTSAQPAHWLFPVTSFALYAQHPSMVMDAPLVADVVAATLTLAGARQTNPHQPNDVLLYPALYNAVALCIVVLKVCRSSVERETKCFRTESHITGELVEDSTHSLYSFERMLLRHEVIHSLATIASGTSRAKDFYARTKASRTSARCRTLLEIEGNWSSNFSNLDDMASECLSLLVNCLSERSTATGRPTLQIPWPGIGCPSLGRWRGRGEIIRRGFAVKMQKSGVVHVAAFLSDIIVCRQRAASRALFGPASGVVRASINAHELPVDIARRENEILAATVDRLDDLKAAWVRWSRAKSSENPYIQVEAEIAASSAACVRVLRSMWEVHGRVWILAPWVAMDVWKRLAALLRCSFTSTQAAIFDIGSAIKVKPELDEKCDNIWNVLWDQKSFGILCNVTDSQSTWRAVVADIFAIFTTEVGIRAHELLSLRRMVVTATGSEGSISIGPDELDHARRVIFGDPAFVALRESFTEQWMLVFLDASHTDTVRCALASSRFGFFDLRMQKIENYNDQLSKEISGLLLDRRSDTKLDILSQFCLQADGSRRYGGEYKVDVKLVEKVLRACGIRDKQLWRILGLVAVLNVRLSRTDAQLRLTRAFASLATLMVVTDTFSPEANKRLTYASPQYCGKLCRVLVHALALAGDSSCICPSTLPSQAELAILLGFASARISSEELEQGALSSVRGQGLTFGIAEPDKSQMAPLGEIAVIVRRYSQLLRISTLCTGFARRQIVSIIRWLLLSGSRLAPGPAFRGDRDLSAFADSAFDALRCGALEANISSSVAVSLSAVLCSKDVPPQPLTSRQGNVSDMFGAIATLVSMGDSPPDEKISAVSALVLLMTQLSSQFWGISSVALLDKSALQHLSSGSIAALLPPGSDPIPPYNRQNGRREPIHRLWCAVLSLGSSLIAQVEPRLESCGSSNSHLDGVLEFAASNSIRVAGATLDSTRDWRPSPVADGETSTGGGFFQKHITMARVEEAELAMAAMYALSGHALDLRDALPHVIDSFIASAVRLVFHAYRLIRAEPMERWVRPVSADERESCDARRHHKEYIGHSIAHGFSGSSSPWMASPVMSPSGGGAGPSPRRTPQEALRLALGGLSSRGVSTAIPPSPGMPSTPQHQSPMSVATALRSGGPTGSYQSPLSPWSHDGGGLITGTGYYFGEEVTRSVLRALGSALGALRRFSNLLDRPVFAPTMKISEDIPSVGLLVGIQFHACNEIQRGAEGERRDALLLMLDNALQLALAHAVHFSCTGQLTAGLRDELHKRIETVIKRMRRVVPPPPSYSIVHANDIDIFLSFFKSV